MHDERRSAGGIEVVERRLGWTIAARVAGIVQALAVCAAARVSAVLRVITSALVGVGRVSAVLGRQQTSLCTRRNLNHALALQHDTLPHPLNWHEFHFGGWNRSCIANDSAYSYRLHISPVCPSVVCHIRTSA